MQERHNSIANAMELLLSCTNPLKRCVVHKFPSLMLFAVCACLDSETGEYDDTILLVLEYTPPQCSYSRLILGLHTSNERRGYKITASLIGWA